MSALTAKVEHLKVRAQDLGATPRDWRLVASDAARLRAGAAYATAVTGALALDGTVTGMEDQWPPEVLRALEHLGLTDRWDPTSLTRTLGWISDKQQQGLISTLKGAMLEQQVVELGRSAQLDLPHGADDLELAATLNQPGWDAQLTSDGDAVGYVQIKATDIAGIREHLDRYPDIPDVITTSETARQAASRGIGVIDSGVLDADLTELAKTATDSLDFGSAFHEVIPGSAAAVILVMASLRVRRGEPIGQAATWARGELGAAGAAHLAGLAVEVGTGTAMFRPVTSVVTKLSIRRAKAAGHACEHFSRLRGQLEQLRLRTEMAES